VLKVSIIPRGVGALGYTIQRPTEDRFLLSQSDLQNRITVLMGGRAAEALIFAGEISTGAADDLQRATAIAFEMVTRYGMAGATGQRTYLPPQQPFLGGLPIEKPNASEETLREIDVESRDLVDQAFDRAFKILRERMGDLEAGATLLLQKETITADDFPPLRQSDMSATVEAACFERPGTKVRG